MRRARRSGGLRVEPGPELLIAREAERKRIERLLAEARDGRSDRLVVSGEAGLGKTALLEWAIEQSSGMQVLSAAGVETAAELPFDGLKGLCASLLDRLDLLRSPQREALAVALDLREPTSPGDRFAVYSGFFELLANAAAESTTPRGGRRRPMGRRGDSRGARVGGPPGRPGGDGSAVRR